jgi:hypothetical protein
MTISRLSILRMENVSDGNCRESKKNTFYTQRFFFFFENRIVYEIMWKIMEEPERPQMRTQHMRLTHAQAHAPVEICNNYCFSTATTVSWSRLNVTLPMLFIFVTEGSSNCFEREESFISTAATLIKYKPLAEVRTSKKNKSFSARLTEF